MQFQKYYDDIKRFPGQFAEGARIAEKVALPRDYPSGGFDRIVLCGMGGSSLPGDLINNMLSAEKTPLSLEMSRSYSIPKNSNKKTFFLVCSYSGNTEETLSAYGEIKAKGFRSAVLASGGKLLELAKKDGVPAFVIPTGLQPRLSTGYIISGIFSILEKMSLVPKISEKLQKASSHFASLVDEKQCQRIAEKIKGKVPVIYAEEENFSVARIGKIKMNENAKTQAFWNFFPELNHNEMVGFTNLVMTPFFLIFDSDFSHPQNRKRIEIFSDIMKEKKTEMEVVRFKAENLMEEMLASYYFMDLVSYYLACQYGIDPEPVEMVEEFKKRLK